MIATPKRRRILYVAPLAPGNTSLYRLGAFQRLDQEMIPFDTSAFEPANRYLNALLYRYPVGPLIAPINHAFRRALREHKPDVVWFDKPTQFKLESVELAKQLGATTVCYNQDNPFGPRNDGCWLQFLKIYKLFDLTCLVRFADVERYKAWGLPWVKVIFSYDAAQHFPPPPGWSDADRFRDVSYVGSPHEQRPAFLQALGEQPGVPLSVAGPRWDTAWPEDLRRKFVTGGMMKDAAYRESIWTSKVNLAFVTHLNQDDLAHKAVEIAACAQFLLAERAAGHQQYFAEDKEAVLFGSVEECADKARYYLAHPAERERIAAAGRERTLRSGYDNDSQLARVLWHLDGVEA